MKVWLCLFAILGLASAQQRQPGRGVNFYSREKEAALGAQLASEVRRDTTPLENSAVREYIEQIGRRLVDQLPPGVPGFTFAIITDDRGGSTHEAIALPGGYIFVPAGLILAAQSEAELAGMLAHAMIHVAERHGTRQATRAELVNQASIPLIFMGGWTGASVQQGNRMAVPLGFLSFQRQLELQADRLAAQTMAAAGYDPEALPRYLERTQTDEGPAAASPLPRREIRIAALKEAIGSLPVGSYATADGLAPIREEVRRLTPQPVRRAPSLLDR